MKVKQMPLVALLCLLTLFKGVSSMKTHKIYIKTGEVVAFHCSENSHNMTWSSYTTQRRTHNSSMSSSHQDQMDILIDHRSLIILNASVIHQGNYSCSLRESFNLTVCTTLSAECKDGTEYVLVCYEREACTLKCPDEYIPDKDTTNITSNGVVWLKSDGTRVSGETYSIPSTSHKDKGVYICTRSFLYQGQIYNKTFTKVVDVKPKETVKTAAILSPRDSDVFPVDVGFPLEIDCTAVVYSPFDQLFWSSGNTNYIREIRDGQEICTASLVFKKVLEEDLLKNFSCILDTPSQSNMVTITLARKVHHSYVPLAISIVVTVLTLALPVVIYIKYKILLTLFIRDTLGCHRNISDGKSYDAYLMCYKSDTDAGLNTNERKGLEDVLEERFGYKLCLNDRDVLPGQAAAQTVLDCVEQSRTVVLVPTSIDSGLECGLLSAIHETLVERQANIVLIQTEVTDDVKSGSLVEALHLLSNVGHCVTWRGKDSESPSSSFWKQLRYYLPPGHPQKNHLLLQNMS